MMGCWAVCRLAVFLLLLMLHESPGSKGSALFSEIPESSSAPPTIQGDSTLLGSAPSPLTAMNNYHSRAETPNSHRNYAAAPAPAPSLPWKSSSLSPPPTPGLSMAPISVSSPSSHHMGQMVPVSSPPEEVLKFGSPPTYPPSEDESASSLGAPSPQTDKDNNHSRALTPESQGNYPTAHAPSLHRKSSSTSPQTTPGLSIVPVSALAPSDHHMRRIVPVSAPPDKTLKSTSPPTYPPSEGKQLSKPRQPKPILHPAPEPIISPVKSHFNVSAPSAPFFRSSPKEIDHEPSPAPSPSAIHRHHLRKSGGTVTPTASPSLPPAIYGNILPPDSSSPPLPMGTKNKEKARRSWLNPPDPLLSPTPSPVSTSMENNVPAPSPSGMVPFATPSPVSTSMENNVPAPSPSGMVPLAARPASHPLSSPIKSPRKPKAAVPPIVFTLPPPPPNEDCLSLTCSEPLTNPLPGSPCACIWPMQVGLRLSVSLYTFFPLVSELAQEIAAGVFVKQSQVRIMGANAASEQSDKTVVLIDLVPIGKSFDGTTALLIYQKFWYKQVIIKPNLFGNSYDVLYVRYPGLPPSPPISPSDIIIEGPFTTGNRGRAIKPIGVDIKKQHRRKRLSRSVIAIIVLSSAIIFVLCVGAIWLCLFIVRRRNIHHPLPTPSILLPPVKPSGQAGSLLLGSERSSGSLSYSANIATYTVSAKTFSLGEIERATDNFDNMKILGEGGFGRVYKGVLDNGTEVAVKILKRDDRQGSREFLAEVEMLSRLHHRNLVKLIGICIEERNRCLVYELIPNGSVESHLHGADKETAPLDWNSRMKIALGSARGLAYLHEDSSPRVIHRDFKASNILLEHDFTPKVSDFGLARTALEEENGHISTRVMGTFGYVAPEYAMTGHLLVKSDVYSYGVVLLELLTGRKPVDMSRPPGQENLVSWASPLLTSKEGLEAIIDPALGSNIPFDNVAKVAAIASMCVQPEVSNRPFMGEVVQALKLVCEENEDMHDGSTCRREDSSSKDAHNLSNC